MDFLRQIASTQGCLGCLVFVTLGALSLKPDRRGRIDVVGAAIEGAFGLTFGLAAMFAAIGCSALFRDLLVAIPPLL